MRRYRIILLILPLLVLNAAAAHAATILIYGDSLSAGYGLARDESWAHLLGQRLQEKKLDYTVTNASISGETTLGGVNRIEQALRTYHPTVLILALGANDGLRGADLEAMRKNLERMVRAAQRAKSRVVLVGMRIPPNYGPGYAEKFEAVYRDVAKQQQVPLVPFLLNGFADRREYFQSDNLHPAAIAQPLMVDNIWKALAPIIKNNNNQ